MKKSNKFLTTFLTLTLIFSAIGLFALASMSIDNVEIETTIKKNYSQTPVTSNDHENIAKIFSEMATTNTFKMLLADEISNSQVNDYNSVSMMKILSGANACTFKLEYTRAVNTLRLSDQGINYFISVYLSIYPGLSISVYSPSGDNSVPANTTLPVFSELAYDDIGIPQEYKLYKFGTYFSTLNERPNVFVIVLQIQEGFVALDQTMINDTTYFDNNSKVRYCSDLATIIQNNLNYNGIIDNPSITICGETYNNPFKEYLFVTNDTITNSYHGLCTLPPLPPPPPPPTETDCQRTTWNNSVNDEKVTRVRMPAGNDLLELHHDWCAWWNKNCRLQLDLFASSAFNSETYVPVQPGPYYGWFNEDDLKDKGFVKPKSKLITIPWYYESGEHGNEWKYRWTGKHRRRGDEQAFGLTAQLSGSILFKDKVTGTETKFGANLGASYSIKRTMKDLEIGGDFVYFCDNILVNSNYGTEYSTGDLDFNLREKE